MAGKYILPMNDERASGVRNEGAQMRSGVSIHEDRSALSRLPKTGIGKRTTVPEHFSSDGKSPRHVSKRGGSGMTTHSRT
jgi:hypothetical protein